MGTVFYVCDDAAPVCRQGDFNVLRHKDFDWNSGLGASGCNLIHACTNSGGCMGDKGISHTIGGSMDDLRARYRRGEPKPALPFQEGAYNVAVHLRRGDVEHKVASEQELLLTIARVRETVRRGREESTADGGAL